MTSIDLNSDLGEGFGPWRMGDDRQMLGIVTSANIACGGHAGDPETMFRTLALAAENGVSCGAHPGYADLAGFGRRPLPVPADEAARMVAAQVGALTALAALAGITVRYVKPHGALANRAAVDVELARALVQAIGAMSPRLAILAISGSALESASQAAGITTFSEIYADRGYAPDGTLLPRGRPGALLDDPKAATDRILRWLASGSMATVGGDPIPLVAHSICIHGDTAAAVAMARELRAGLTAAGVALAPFAQ